MLLENQMDFAVLNPKLSTANFPIKLIFQNTGNKFIFLPLFKVLKPLLLELQLILSCMVARSQSTLTCSCNDSSSFHMLVCCTHWRVSVFLFHY